MRAALDPNGADAYWAGRFGLIPLLAYAQPVWPLISLMCHNVQLNQVESQVTRSELSPQLPGSHHFMINENFHREPCCWTPPIAAGRRLGLLPPGRWSTCERSEAELHGLHHEIPVF